MRFDYFNTSFSLACCHLSAGASNINARINEIHDIESKSFKDMKFKEHDMQFIFGDLNFRIDLDINTCLQMIESKNLPSLIIYDQLNKAKTTSTTLIEFEEGELDFNPSYKYVVGGIEYDMKKKRVPSWCDRILFRKNKNIKILEYGRVDYIYSDHKPVYGVYNLKFSKVDEEKKRHVIREVRKNLSNNIVSMNVKDVSSIYF
jgi:hypothetical protein